MGQVTKQSLLERKIEKAIENQKEITLLKEYFQYTIPKEERNNKNFIKYLDPILDEYLFHKRKSPNYYAKFLSIYNHLKE